MRRTTILVATSPFPFFSLLTLQLALPFPPHSRSYESFIHSSSDALSISCKQHYITSKMSIPNGGRNRHPSGEREAQTLILTPEETRYILAARDSAKKMASTEKAVKAAANLDVAKGDLRSRLDLALRPQDQSRNHSE